MPRSDVRGQWQLASSANILIGSKSFAFHAVESCWSQDETGIARCGIILPELTLSLHTRRSCSSWQAPTELASLGVLSCRSKPQSQMRFFFAFSEHSCSLLAGPLLRRSGMVELFFVWPVVGSTL